jgi:23S rRNA pseudouridine2604 synthase
MADRPKLRLKPAAPPRDPRRRPVRAATAPPRRPDDRVPPAAAARDRREPEAPRAPARPRPTPAAPPAAPGRPSMPPPRTAARPDPRPWAGRPEPPGRPPNAPKPGPRVPVATGVRVSKLLTERGLASRREADEWIAAGWVRVDGRIAVLGQRTDPQAAIEIDERARREQSRRVTILLHKPLGWVSGQAEDGHAPAVNLVTPANRWAEDRSGTGFHPGHLRGLAPAGRLDIDSTGLLVLTQDGRIAKRLIGDDTRVEKEYLVRVEPLPGAVVDEHAIERLRHGLELDGRPLRPAKVSWQNEDQLRVVLREGRKRQIRRMCEQVGLRVLALKRVRIGSVALGALPPGQWRYLGEHERF